MTRLILVINLSSRTALACSWAASAPALPWAGATLTSCASLKPNAVGAAGLSVTAREAVRIYARPGCPPGAASRRHRRREDVDPEALGRWVIAWIGRRAAWGRRRRPSARACAITSQRQRPSMSRIARCGRR